MEYFLLKQTKALNLCPSSTECCFLKSYLPLSSTASKIFQGAAEQEVCSLFPCPAPPQSRWCMAEVTHAVTSLVDLRGWQRSEHSPANWTTETPIGAESLCQITADSSNPLIFLSFWDMFGKSFAHAVYSLWVILSVILGRESAFGFWWHSLKYQEKKE